MEKPFVIPLDKLTIDDVPETGGKNASLGEMIQNLAKKGIDVPSGYAITATAYRHFLKQTGLEIFIKEKLSNLDTKNLHQLSTTAKLVRDQIIKTEFPQEIKHAIINTHKLAEHRFGKDSSYAVRSSATAEDLPDASFAGEHETYLNIKGIENILQAVKEAMASLFTDRAISYRVDKKFDHFSIALSVGVQKMIRSDIGASGVMFTLDTETGFPDLILINGAWGLGEMVVQGKVTPDEFLVYKKTLGESKRHNLFQKTHFKPIIDKKLGPKQVKMVYQNDSNHPTKIIETSKKEQQSFVLTDQEILKLATWGKEIEKHYSQKHGKWTPMDTEWAKDGETGKLYIVQARPETIHSTRDYSKVSEYIRTQNGKTITKGASVGSKIASAKARVILDVKDITKFEKGEILVTEITDPDWEPIMKIASAIVTDKGGRTSHAAIVSRELGIPCVVGSGNATKLIKTGDLITVDTTGSDGLVLEGQLKFRIEHHDIKNIPKTKTHIMMNIATPETAFEKSFLPNSGVGLAREEFIIASDIGIHPNALLNFENLKTDLKNKIAEKTIGYQDKTQFYIDKLSYGIAKIGAAFSPNPVIVRLSDFKTNEYRSLLGGEEYEPEEENPMIGWRGASRYYHPDFTKAFGLEIKAIKKVRQEMGLENVKVMIPFCRTPQEGRKVIKIMEENGLSRKKDKTLQIYVMCEIPSNIILANEFLDIFDGMSIGSNDLTQLTLGIDRDGNEKIKSIANENDESIKILIKKIIKKCQAKSKYIGICGQAPSDYPEFALFLVKAGINSISLNPDTIIKTTLAIAKAENR